MSLLELRTSIVDSITAEVGAFQTVQAHGGKFDRDEVKRIATKSPAALVAILGGEVDREAEEAVGDLTMVVFIVTRGTSEGKRDEGCLILAEAVAKLAVENKWKFKDSKAPESIRIDNLFSGSIDRLGVALWSVSWVQRTDLNIFDTGTLDEFRTLHADIDLEPADGVVDFQQIISLFGELMSAYGHINVSTPIATAIALADTYQKAAGTTALKLNKDVDMPVVGRLRHTGTVAKPFMATASMSVTVAANAKVTLAFAKNGVVDADVEIEEDLTLAGGAEVLSLKHIVSLDQNDYIEVWVKADSAIGVTLEKMNLVLAAT